MMEEKIVYNYPDHTPAFKGTLHECHKWILDQGFHMPDGRIIYRTWKEDCGTVYDVGNLYILNEN